MTEKNRKAVVAQNGRSITVLDAKGQAWKCCPSSFCEWAARARDPKRPSAIGFGQTIWKAIKNAEAR